MGLFAARASFEVAGSRYLAAGLAAGHSGRRFGIKAHLVMFAESGLYFRQGLRIYQSLVVAAAADLKRQIWSSAGPAAEADLNC